MKKTYDLIFSIGSKCKVSYNLRRLGLQQESFPFDWIYIVRPGVVEMLFDTNFKNFFLEENLVLRSKQPRFDEVTDLGTGIYSAHDFATDRSIHECYTEVKKKFDRRIEKLKARINEAERILMVHCAEDEFFSDEQIVADFEALQKRFASKKLEMIYFYHPAEKISYERKQLAPNVVKISAYRDVAFDWQGRKELFDESLSGIRLSFKSKWKWYTSKTYLGGLKRKLKTAVLKFVGNLIPLKKFRKVFRNRYLEKSNRFN